VSDFLIVRPFDIDDAALVSSNVPEDDYPQWDGVTSWGLGDRVIIISAGSPTQEVHNIYESLQAGNSGHNPLDDVQAPHGVPVYWILVGKTNRWKMFDNRNSSQTVRMDSIEVELQIARRPNSVALLNVEAASIEVIMKDANDLEVFNQTFSMVENSGEPSFYNWFFQQIQRRTDLFVDGLPPLAGGKIFINILNPDEEAKCGTCVIGYAEPFGETQLGAEVGIIDFSVKRQNEFGDYDVLERAYSREGRFPVFVSNSIIDRMQTLLAERRAIPTLYIAAERYSCTYIYGFYEDMANVIQYNDFSLFNIRVIGLT
jgi:hypothetical protein